MRDKILGGFYSLNANAQRRALCLRCSAGLGADDFIQSFDDLSQFIKIHFPESLADPFSRQRAYLADLNP